MIQETLEILASDSASAYRSRGRDSQAFRDDRFERWGIAGLNRRTATSRNGRRSSKSRIAQGAGTPLSGRSGI